MKNDPTPPTSNWRLFRSQVWFGYVRRNANSSEIDGPQISELGESSKLQFKWARGSISATRKSAKKYSSIEGSLNIFDLEIFPLLDLTNFPIKTLRSYLKDNTWPELGDTWFFESDLSTIQEIGRRRLNSTYQVTDFLEYQGSAYLNGQIPSIRRNDSLKLATRGDINGFTAILALLREAENTQDLDIHAYHAASLIRALPTIAQTPVFAAHKNQLIDFIKSILNKIPDYRERVKIDWRNVESQIKHGTTITPWYLLGNLEDMCPPPEAQNCVELLI
ncbi:hypothetical protein [Teredinibacter turnerae]|uniref:hypothetical protein n=1 Tax=Teredinibacter turnerae TaxID=2426 RepID=UPI0030CAA02E